MGVITVVVGFSLMQQRVKDESSQVAARAFDKDGNALFELFVLDEGYETRFRSYFASAIGEVAAFLSAYTKDMPSASFYQDTSMASDDDFVVQLPMPATFDASLTASTGIKIEDFFEAYILFLWLSTKDAAKAEFYFARAEKLKSDINADLNKRFCSVRRPIGYW